MFLCNELHSKLIETGHFQPGPAKYKYKHSMMWLSAEMYRVWGGCRTRDVKNI